MIYADNNATTALLPEVREAAAPYFANEYGNPNSAHQAGNRARIAIEKARGRIAALLGATPGEITFTGSGSEGNNHAVLGSLFARLAPGKNLVISAVEHASVRASAEWAAAKFGIELRIAPIRFLDGKVDPAPFLERIDAHTLLVSVMFANNETGVLLPAREIFAAARACGAWSHCDAVQGFGKCAFQVKELGCDMLTLSGHKFHAPKGIGALYIRRGIQPDSLLHGGPQEHGRRAGTESVADIVALGAAADCAAAYDCAQIGRLRDDFERDLLAQLPGKALINCGDVARTPNVSSVRFPQRDANLLLIKLDQRNICVSTGSACSSGALTPSRALLAFGLNEAEARASLRFSFSRFNTHDDLANILAALTEILATGR